VSVPFTIAGSLIARKLLKGIKQRPYREALARYEEVESAYSGKALEMASELSAAAHAAVTQQRSAYLTHVGWPPGIEQAAAAELAALTANLRTATPGYLSSVQAVLEASPPQPADLDADDRSGTVLPDFRERNSEIGTFVSAKAHTAKHECAAAEAVLKEAAEAVEREAQALGFKSSER
jgi:hypothetical protein